MLNITIETAKEKCQCMSYKIHTSVHHIDEGEPRLKIDDGQAVKYFCIFCVISILRQMTDLAYRKIRRD